MLLKDKQGQGIVEFAFVIPIFVFLLIGFLHMALVLHDYLAMGEGAREMARYAAVGRTDEEINANVDFGVSGFYKIVPPDGTNTYVRRNLQNDQLGNFVEVKVTMRFDDKQGVLLTEKFMPKELSTTLAMREE